jgi:hypothetical protein
VWLRNFKALQHLMPKMLLDQYSTAEPLIIITTLTERSVRSLGVLIQRHQQYDLDKSADSTISPTPKLKLEHRSDCWALEVVTPPQKIQLAHDSCLHSPTVQNLRSPFAFALECQLISSWRLPHS